MFEVNKKNSDNVLDSVRCGGDIGATFERTGRRVCASSLA